MRSRVVLPVPFGPISAVTEPAPIRKVTSASSGRPSGRPRLTSVNSRWPTPVSVGERRPARQTASRAGRPRPRRWRSAHGVAGSAGAGYGTSRDRRGTLRSAADLVVRRRAPVGDGPRGHHRARACGRTGTSLSSGARASARPTPCCATRSVAPAGLTVRSDSISSERGLSMTRTPGGPWLDGAGKSPPQPELDLAVDIDLTASAFTNSLAIRRLGLHTPSGDEEITVAEVAIPELGVEAVKQRYRTVERIDDGAPDRLRRPGRPAPADRRSARLRRRRPAPLLPPRLLVLIPRVPTPRPISRADQLLLARMKLSTSVPPVPKPRCSSARIKPRAVRSGR